jgi:hypothetical protein
MGHLLQMALPLTLFSIVFLMSVWGTYLVSNDVRAEFGSPDHCRNQQTTVILLDTFLREPDTTGRRGSHQSNDIARFGREITYLHSLAESTASRAMLH